MIEMHLVRYLTAWEQEQHLMASITSLQKYMQYSANGSEFAIPGETDVIYKNLLVLYHEQYGGK